MSHHHLGLEAIRGTMCATAVDLVNTFEERYSENFKSLVSDALRVYKASSVAFQSTCPSSSSSSSSAVEDSEVDLSPVGLVLSTSTEMAFK